MNPIPPSLPSRPFLTGLFATLVAATAGSAQSSVVYRETFGNGTGANDTFASAGWTAYSATTDVTGDATNAPVSNLAGRVQNLSNLGQNQIGASQANGFGVFGSGASQLNNFAFTTEYNGSPVGFSSLGSISFYQGNNAADVNFRAAIQVEGNWYVTAAQTGANVGAAGNFAANAVRLTFADLASSSWSGLTFVPGSSLSVGATTTVPDTVITGFGVFVTKASTGNIVRFDTFEVTTIPEPATATALLGLCALGIGAARRRVSHADSK